MKKTFLVLSILLMLFAGGVWGDYWDYDGCGHDQKPCLTKEGNLMEGRYEKKIGPMSELSVDYFKGMLNGRLLIETCRYGARPDGHLYVKANFKEGKFHGIVDIYNAYRSDGVLVCKQTWVDGELKSGECGL
tara:strand:+ start:82 stop:477 length:396 start_codon:yes stop_codon:yes gene_type:complete